MKKTDKAQLWGCLAVLLFLVWLGFAVPIAMASGDCKGQSCNDSGDVNVGGDTINVGGDTITGGDVSVPVNVNTDVAGGPVNVEHKSESLGIGLSNSLGDVDIAGCLGSTQWATPLFSKQKLVVNWPCLAEFYLEHGKYELAAMAICNTEIIKEFEDEAACEAAHDFAPFAEPVGEIIKSFDSSQEEQNEYLDVIQMAQASIEQRLEALESRPRPRPTSRPTAAPQPAFTEEQKAAAWAALKGEGANEDE
jgi:hypothetical protein